jgi:hypothetical protein
MQADYDLDRAKRIPGKRPDMSFCLSFPLALLGHTGAHSLDDPPDLSCKENTRQHSVDDPLLSCKQQVEGSSPGASSRASALVRAVL